MSKTKRFLALATAAAALAVIAPSTAGAAAVGPCQVRPVGGFQEWYQDVLVTGESAPRGAIDVELTCGVVRYGETVATATDGLAGPAAVVAEVETVHAGPVSSCYVLHVTYVTHYTYTDTCP
jgi:hypothetical protein